MAATTQNVYQVGFPEQLAPYAEDLVKTASAFTDITQNPYQQYLGERVAQYSPLQQQAQAVAAGMAPSQQIGVGSDIATIAGSNALNTGYGPAQFNTQSFNQPGVSQSYMSPYMQNVVDVQQQEAKRQAGIASNAMGAQAAQAGAYGGARQAIERGQANRNLQAQLANIQAQGLQSAYTQGQQQFNTEQAAKAQAQQLGEQSRQFGANLGMQGQQTGLQAASILGNLGQQQATQLQDITKLQSAMGSEQQAQAQKILDTQYQDFLDYQNYPYKQMGFMSDILRGAPLTQTGSSVYQQAPSTSQSLLSAGMGAAGISKLLKAGGGMVGKGYAAGGITQAYAPGGSVMSPDFKRYAVDRIDPRLLQLAQRNAMARGDVETANYAVDEMAEDAAMRRGLAAALPEGVDVVRAAGGGILAFDNGGATSEDSEAKSTTNDDSYIDAILAKGMDDEEGGGSTFTANPQVASIANALMNAKTRTLTPSAQRELFNYNLQRGIRDLGPNAGADEYSKYLQGLEGARTDNMNRGHGMTLLRAAKALGKSGVNDSDRWGEMFGAIADSEEKLQAADQAQQHYLANAKFALADAKRKERAGLVNEARSSTNAYVKYMQEAEKNAMLGKKYAGELLVNQDKARALAARGGGAGKGPKLAEQLAAAEVAYEKDPSQANLQEVTGLRRAMDRARTSESGAGKLATANEANEIKRSKMYEEALGELRITPAYKKATTAEKKTMEAEAKARIMKQPLPADNATPEKNDYSHLWSNTNN